MTLAFSVLDISPYYLTEEGLLDLALAASALHEDKNGIVLISFLPSRPYCKSCSEELCGRKEARDIERRPRFVVRSSKVQ